MTLREYQMLIDIEENLYTKLLLLRSIQRLVSTPSFKEAFDFGNDCERKEINRLIDKYDKEGVCVWIDGILEKKVLHNAVADNINDKTLSIVYKYTVKELRIYARRIGVQYYSAKTKYELIEEIEQYVKMICNQQKYTHSLKDKINVFTQQVKHNHLSREILS